MTVETPRLTLVPMTAELVARVMSGPEGFQALLQAEIPSNWPPELMRDALPWFAEQIERNRDQIGWLGWYSLCRQPEGQSPVLVGSGGFLGPPENETAEVGYSVLPQFQGLGYGTEMVQALVLWAMAQTGVMRVVAGTGEKNLPSRRLLEKLGFGYSGPGREPGDLRFEFRGK